MDLLITITDYGMAQLAGMALGIGLAELGLWATSQGRYKR